MIKGQPSRLFVDPWVDEAANRNQSQDPNNGNNSSSSTTTTTTTTTRVWRLGSRV